MTITRAQCEQELVRRAKKKMLAVDMSVVVDGTNDDLSGPLAFAARVVGLTLASPITVTTAELANLSDDDIDELLDRAELRLFENIEGNIDTVDIKLGPHWEAKNQLAEQLQKKITSLRAAISSKYGDDTGTLTAGSLLLDFASKHDDTVSS